MQIQRYCVTLICSIMTWTLAPSSAIVEAGLLTTDALTKCFVSCPIFCPMIYFGSCQQQWLMGYQIYSTQELPSEELSSLLFAVNLPTVAKKPKLVDKAIHKEECNHLLMIFSKHLAYFIKLGVLDNKNKKPQMYRHGSYISESSTDPAHKLVDYDLSEPVIGYKRVLKHHVAYL